MWRNRHILPNFLRKNKIEHSINNLDKDLNKNRQQRRNSQKNQSKIENININNDNNDIDNGSIGQNFSNINISMFNTETETTNILRKIRTIISQKWIWKKSLS